jgi:phosphoglycerol transferase MdoB-like AlkP superfamily enzyme
MIKRVLIEFFFLIIVFLISKISFYIYNYNYFNFEIIRAIKIILIEGLRFDISTISKIFGIYFLLNWIYCSSEKILFLDKILNFFKKITFIFSTGLLFAGALVYNFIQKHVTLDLVNSAGEVQGLIRQLFNNHLLYLIYAICMVSIGVYLYSKILKFKVRKIKFINLISSLIVSVFLVALFVRGGVQGIPLYGKHAYIGEDYKEGDLRGNTLFFMISSLQRENNQKDEYMDENLALMKTRKIVSQENSKFIQNSDFFRRKNFKRNEHIDAKKNIVIIVLEGVGSEYISEISENNKNPYTPFLSELALKNSYLYNFYSNGYYTSDVFPAIMTAMPVYHNKNLIMTDLLDQNIPSMPRILSKIGYDTLFLNPQFHASITLYMRSIGFNKIVDENDFNSELKGPWGYHDEVSFSKFSKSLDKMTPPFLASMISMSTHAPYEIPNTFSNKFKDPFHNALFYLDTQLKKFFTHEISKERFKNTIYVITSDHTRNVNSKLRQNSFRVPLIMVNHDINYLNNNISASHVDILPTIIDILDVDSPYSGFGSSILKKNGMNFNFMTNKTNYF